MVRTAVLWQFLAPSRMRFGTGHVIWRHFLALSAGICALHFATACIADPDLSDANLSNPDVIAAGKKRFNRSCFYCHGYEASGGKAATLQRRPDLAPDFIFNTISNGRTRGSAVMPPWKNTLSEEEISQLVAYIVSLRDMPEQK